MIKAIIFDFAGVLTKEGFKKSLIKRLKRDFNFDENLFSERFTQYENPYMLNQIDSVEFWKKVCSGLQIPYEQYAEAFVNCYELNPEMLNLIAKLKEKYRIIMLSDNFDILSEKIKKDTRITSLFEKIFLSNEINQIKTHPDSFGYVIESIKELPENCVFTDDKEKNLVHAAKLGLKTIHFRNVPNFVSELSRLGVAA